MLHTPAHKHVGDAGKPGQLVNLITEPLNEAQAELARQVSDPMYRHSCVTAAAVSRNQPGQIVHRIDEGASAAYILHGTATGRFTSTTSNMEEVQRGRAPAEDVSKSKAGIGHMLRDLMYQHGVSPFNPTQRQAKTPKDTL